MKTYKIKHEGKWKDFKPCPIPVLGYFDPKHIVDYFDEKEGYFTDPVLGRCNIGKAMKERDESIKKGI